MIALTGPDGKKVFESIAITLVRTRAPFRHPHSLTHDARVRLLQVCDACLKTEHPEQCRHKMSEIPRWISSQKVEIVRTMLSDVSTEPKLHNTLFIQLTDDVRVQQDPAMLLRESLGISADGSEKLYRDDDITAFEQRKPEELIWIDRDHRLNVQHVFVSVDPSGGGASAFSVCSALMKANGTIQVTAAPTAATTLLLLFFCQPGRSASGSSGHNVHRVAHMAAKASGRWPRLAK